MPLSIGNTAHGYVTLADGDMPAQLTMGGELINHEQALSDGTNLLIITGEKPQALSLTGTIRRADDQGRTPQQQMDALDTIRKAHQEVTVHWSPPSGQGGWAQTMVLLVARPTLVKGYHVNYQIELARGVALQDATAATAPTSPATATMAQMATLAQAAGPQATAAWATLEALVP